MHLKLMLKYNVGLYRTQNTNLVGNRHSACNSICFRLALDNIDVVIVAGTAGCNLTDAIAEKKQTIERERDGREVKYDTQITEPLESLSSIDDDK